MTKYCVMRECDNIHSWISTTGDLAFSHQQEFTVLNSQKIASHIGPGLKSQPGFNFFSLIFVRIQIHTNEFIQLLYKLCSMNSYTMWFLYQFIHFVYELYITNSYNEP
jgi:hypothetical protein